MNRLPVFAPLLIATMLATAPVAEAGTMFFVGGTYPNPMSAPPVKSQEWLGGVFNGRFADDVEVSVDYPASVWPLTFNRPTMGRSVRIGADMTAGLVNGTAGEITIVGISQGALVVDALAAQLKDPSLVDRVSLLAVADPNRPGGLFSMLPIGTYIPILNLTAAPPAVSPYDTTVLVNQYDGLSNFPDRPWRLLSVANAMMGMYYHHVRANWVHVEIPSSGGVSTTNPLGGVTTTYLIPSPDLPLTESLRTWGVPAALVERLDQRLRPLINAGYSALTPAAGPHIEYGRLVRPVPAPAAVSSPVAGQRPALPAARGGQAVPQVHPSSAIRPHGPRPD